MKIDGFTISYAFDTNSRNLKSSNFISVNFKLPEPTEVDDVELLRIEASKKVTIWAIQDALMRGELTQSEAKERLEIVKSNFDGFKSALQLRKSEG